MEDKLHHVRSLMKYQSLDAVLLSSQSQILYITGYEGFSPLEREAYLLITKKNVYLFTDARYTHGVNHLSLVSVREINSSTTFVSLLSSIITDEKIQTMGIEENNLTVSEYIKIKRLTKLKSYDTHSLRIKKTEGELSQIQKACQIGDKAFKHILTVLRPGITEKEIADALEQFIKKQRASLSFPSIVAFGKNSAIPHHHTSHQTLKKRDIVLLDFGVRFNNYCSDMTRTIFIGKPTKKQSTVYETVLQAQLKAYKALQQGERRAAKIDKKAREHILTNTFPTIPHAVGHGIGIDVHEAPTISPKSKDILENGMVFSLEPGIYFPDEFGVRIEDLVSLQKETLIPLTRSSKKLIQL